MGRSRCGIESLYRNANLLFNSVEWIHISLNAIVATSQNHHKLPTILNQMNIWIIVSRSLRAINRKPSTTKEWFYSSNAQLECVHANRSKIDLNVMRAQRPLTTSEIVFNRKSDEQTHNVRCSRRQLKAMLTRGWRTTRSTHKDMKNGPFAVDDDKSLEQINSSERIECRDVK